MEIQKTLATYKDIKIVFDKFRLNTWHEDIKFTVVTEGTYLRFDDLRVEFVTKSKQLALQSKIRGIKVKGRHI